jgi:hypothetical protein
MIGQQCYSQGYAAVNIDSIFVYDTYMYVHLNWWLSINILVSSSAGEYCDCSRNAQGKCVI